MISGPTHPPVGPEIFSTKVFSFCGNSFFPSPQASLRAPPPSAKFPWELLNSKPGREVSSRQLLLWGLPQTPPEPEQSPVQKRQGWREISGERHTPVSQVVFLPSISTQNGILWGLPRCHPSSALRWVTGWPGGCKERGRAWPSGSWAGVSVGGGGFLAQEWAPEPWVSF